MRFCGYASNYQNPPELCFELPESDEPLAIWESIGTPMTLMLTPTQPFHQHLESWSITVVRK